MAKYSPVKFGPHIYPDWWEILKTLTDKQRTEFLYAVLHFPEYEPEDIPLWSFFKTQIDNQYSEYQRRREASKANRNCSRQYGIQSSAVNHSRPWSTTVVNENENENGNENGNGNENENGKINITHTSNLDDVKAEFQLASQDSETPEPKVEPKENHNEPVPYKEIQGIYNSICVPGCRKCTAMTDSRKTLVRTRMSDLKTLWGENTIENFKRLFTLVSQSDFLMGRSTPTNGHENFRVGIDWILNNKNMMKIVEGNYSGENEIPSGTFQNAVSSEQIERDRQAHIKALREQMGAFL